MFNLTVQGTLGLWSEWSHWWSTLSNCEVIILFLQTWLNLFSLTLKILRSLPWVNYFSKWSIMLVSIPNSGSVHFSTSRIMYFWTRILLSSWVFECSLPLLLMFWWNQVTDGGGGWGWVSMSSASLSVMGQDKPTCNISTNTVRATNEERNFLVAL